MQQILLVVLLGATTVLGNGVSLYPAPLDVGFTRNVGESYLRDSRVRSRGYDEGLLGYGSVLGYPGYSNRFLRDSRVLASGLDDGLLGYDGILGYPGYPSRYLRNGGLFSRGYGGLLGHNSLFGYPGYSNRHLSSYDRVAYNREASGRFGYDRLLPSYGAYPHGLYL